MEVAAGSIGIASFVIQIANSVARLKSFWDSTKEAPEDIKFMIEEIEILSSILSEIDVQNKQHQIPTTGNACAVKSLQLCRQGMDILLDVVKELDQNIAKRKHLGAIKACLKKDSLARHRARLESAKTMLLLSNQAYFTALQRQTLDLQRQWSRDHVWQLGELKTVLSGKAPVTVPSSSLTFEGWKEEPSTTTRPSTHGSWSSCSWLEYFLGSVYYQKSTTRATSRKCSCSNPEDEHEEVAVRFRIPAWLDNKAWEARSIKARSGWTIKLQTFNIVPRNSKVFAYAYKGNLEGLRNLFERHEASPFDRDEKGFTALHWAAYGGRLEACRLLIDQGADGRTKTNIRGGSFPLELATYHARKWAASEVDRRHIMELLKFFIVDCENDVLSADEDDPGAPLRAWFGGPPEAMVLMQQQLYPPYNERPLSERVGFALDLDCQPYHAIRQDVLRTAIGRGPVEPSAYHVQNAYGETILTWIAGALGGHISQNRTMDVIGWRMLLRECVMAQADLCVLTTYADPSGQTALTRFIQGFVEDNTTIRALSLDLGYIVRLWAEELSNAGVDLLEYGRQEKQLHDANRIGKTVELYIGIDRGGETHFESEGEWRPWRFISFTYGPSLADWQAWGSNPRDEFAGEFWRKVEPVERIEERMPGSWIDDDEHLSENEAGEQRNDGVYLYDPEDGTKLKRGRRKGEWINILRSPGRKIYKLDLP